MLYFTTTTNILINFPFHTHFPYYTSNLPIFFLFSIHKKKITLVATHTNLIQIYIQKLHLKHRK